MTDIFPASVQRSALLAFAAALGSRPDTLRRDECGDWRINGKHGHIFAVPDGFQIYFGSTPRAWGFAKAAMAFAKVTQDGEGDGILVLDRHPTPAQAVTLREKLGIPKRVELSASEVDRRRSQGSWMAKNWPSATAPLHPYPEVVETEKMGLKV
jgi:hypothetical protein